MKSVCRSVGALGAMAVASSAFAGTVVARFDLFNHPDGNVAPSAYGMRLDDFGGDDPATFSFEDGSGNSTVRMTVIDNGGGMFELKFSGTVRGNSASGGTDFGEFAIDVSYTINGGSLGTGWSSMVGDGVNIGTISGTAGTNAGTSPLLNGQSFDLLTRSLPSGEAFTFAPDDHRLGGHGFPAGTWVGRGWIEAVGGGFFDSNSSDWLFVGVQFIPLPTTGLMGLAGLGLVAGVRRRR